MATVKLEGERLRGEQVTPAGTEYECSDAEAATLIASGLASAVKGSKAAKVEREPEVETAAEVAPETAAQPKAKGR